jgi:hypothetical protein
MRTRRGPFDGRIVHQNRPPDLHGYRHISFYFKVSAAPIQFLWLLSCILGLVHTIMDHDVGPWKKAFFNGPSSWSSFHGPTS